MLESVSFQQSCGYPTDCLINPFDLSLHGIPLPFDMALKGVLEFPKRFKRSRISPLTRFTVSSMPASSALYFSRIKAASSSFASFGMSPFNSAELPRGRNWCILITDPGQFVREFLNSKLLARVAQQKPYLVHPRHVRKRMNRTSPIPHRPTISRSRKDIRITLTKRKPGKRGLREVDPLVNNHREESGCYHVLRGDMAKGFQPRKRCSARGTPNCLPLCCKGCSMANSVHIPTGAQVKPTRWPSMKSSLAQCPNYP